MKELYYCKIAESGNGLCNQLFSLVTGIIIALQKGIKIIIVDEFLNDYSRNIKTPLSDIIDLNTLNTFLKSNYNITVLDRNKINFTVQSAKYGVEENNIDITDIIKENYCKHNILSINTNVNLNKIAGNDPVIGQKKYLEITYLLNGNLIKEKYEELNEFLKTKVEFNVYHNKIFVHTMCWMNQIDRNKFDNILKNITFMKKFDILKDENKIITQYNKINIIHLRVEEDAIKHWSRQNNMNPLFFKNVIERKYINNIYKYINKNDMTILLTYSTQNGVIEFLKNNGYNYHISHKVKEWGRELNAIKDTNMINLCNNIFIGNFNLEKLNGSSLSYFLLNNIKNPNVKRILIDVDRILMPEQIITN